MTSPANDEAQDARVILALERTLLAWTRTALALMGFGFVAARLAIFLRELNPQSPTPGGSRWIGLAVVALGGVVQAVAIVTHARSVRRIRDGERLPLRVMSPATILGGVLILLATIVTLYLATI